MRGTERVASVPDVDDVLGEVLAVARRRERLADVELGPVVDHLAATLPVVVDDLGLRVDGWSGQGLWPAVLVTLPDGTPGVLKVRLPGELDLEARVMAAGPAAYAAVLVHDAQRGVLVTERLGEHLGTVHVDLAAQVAVVAPLLRLAWETPREAGGPVGHKAERLLEILADLGGRYAADHARAVARAEGLAADLSRDERDDVVCHGDGHAGNVLARGEDWAFIDPDGFVGEAAYDVGVLLRDASAELLATEASVRGAATAVLRAACEEASRLAGVDAERAWAWAAVERVTTGLYLHWFGEHAEAERYLAVADLLGD